MPTFRPLLRYPEMDGHRLSRTSCELRIAPVGGAPLIVSGWKSINTSVELAPGKTYANRAKPQGRTRGKFTPTMELELYVEDAELVRVALGTAGLARNLGWMEVAFDAYLTGFEVILGGAFLWEGLGARITKDEMGVSDNDDQLSRKWSLDLMDMRLNGISAVNESTSTGLPG